MNNKKIGQYLRTKRTERKLTQADLAKEFGVTYQAVSRWENGDSIPDIETLVMIADFYQVSLDDILQRDKEQEPTRTTSEEVPTPYSFIILFMYFLFQTLGVTGLWLVERTSSPIWDIIGVISFVMFVSISFLLLYLYYTVLSRRNNTGKKNVEIALRGSNILGIFAIIVFYNRIYFYLYLSGFTSMIILIIQALVITFGPGLLYLLIQYLLYRVRYREHFSTFLAFLFPKKRRVIKLIIIVFISLLLPTIIVGVTPGFTIILFLILALL